jgi:hypothetical protein
MVQRSNWDYCPQMQQNPAAVQAMLQIAASRYSAVSVFYFFVQIGVLIGNPIVVDCIDLPL